MSFLGLLERLFAPYFPAAVIALLTFLFALLGSWLAWRLWRRTSSRLAVIARRLTVAVIALIGGTLSLQALGVNTDVLLVVIGLLGATIVVALREPLANYGAKYFSDIYTPFKLGDSVRVQGHAGKVIEINAMTTVLLSDDDQLVSVPNVMMVRDVVVNTSPQAWKEVVVPVSLGGSVDLATFESEIHKSLAKLRGRLDPRFPPLVTVQSRTAQSTELSLTLMIQRPEDRDPLTAEVNRRVAEVLAGLRERRR